jgi:hypothetical protein
MNRATGKQQQISISPALTPDLIPEPFRLPEGTYPAQFSLGEPPAHPNPANVTISNAETEGNLIKENKQREASPKKARDESSLEKKESSNKASPKTVSLPKDSKLQAETELANQEGASSIPLNNSRVHHNTIKVNQSSKRTSPVYSPEEKVRTQDIVANGSRQNVLAQTDYASSPKANTKQRGSIPQETMQNTPSTSIETVESPSKANVKTGQISTNSHQNLPLEGEGKPSIMPERANQVEVEVSRQLARSAERTPNSEPPNPYPQASAKERWPRLQRAEETTVTIHIGRIEVHAVREQEKPASLPRGPVLSLSDYLKQRSEED